MSVLENSDKNNSLLFYLYLLKRFWYVDRLIEKTIRLECGIRESIMFYDVDIIDGKYLTNGT